MFRIRRATHEPRIELAPMIDVMLFLLTFFIYSVMLMERVDLVPMDLRAYQSGKPAKPAPATTISVDLDGRLFLDRAPVAIDELVEKLEQARAAAPDLVVYLALADGAGEVDRSQLLLDVWDRLQPAKFNVSLVGRQRRLPAKSNPQESGNPATVGSVPAPAPAPTAAAD
ncbi:MAG: biopolymer transporter ExbD [Planctomycetaceae bacterium]|nr:biopolymer transporter ExbD [Planctomycetaceae bacterium]